MSPSGIPVAFLDSGLNGGLRNSAVDRAWLAHRASGGGCDSLRLYRNRPTASIGRHQALDRELRLDYCHREGIEVVRRATGGGALYLDPEHVCFSLVLRWTGGQRDLPLARWLEHGSAAIAAALASLGIVATLKGPNDIEVGGRKIASVFAARQREAVMLQGVVILATDVETMLKVLRVPTEKLSPDGLSAARERLTSVSACSANAIGRSAVKTALMEGIADQFGLRPRNPADAAPLELPRGRHARNEGAFSRSIAWDMHTARKVEALVRVGSNTLRARADFDAAGDRLEGIELATDAHFAPDEFFSRLEQVLEGIPVPEHRGRIVALARSSALDAVGFRAADIVRLLQQLVDKRRFAHQCGLNAAHANALMPLASATGLEIGAVLHKTGMMLVPYCAKPAWCKWRRREGCSECGLCEVGTAYALARERNMQVATITNYEHLVTTLAVMKAHGTEAYIGMCCSHFFIKRYRAFAEAGIPALLMDISGANCYELQQEQLAYAGTFQAEARLDGELLARVMKFVPPRAPSDKA